MLRQFYDEVQRNGQQQGEQPEPQHVVSATRDRQSRGADENRTEQEVLDHDVASHGGFDVAERVDPTARGAATDVGAHRNQAPIVESGAKKVTGGQRAACVEAEELGVVRSAEVAMMLEVT